MVVKGEEVKGGRHAGDLIPLEKGIGEERSAAEKPTNLKLYEPNTQHEHYLGCAKLILAISTGCAQYCALLAKQIARQ